MLFVVEVEDKYHIYIYINNESSKTESGLDDNCGKRQKTASKHISDCLKAIVIIIIFGIRV